MSFNYQLAQIAPNLANFRLYYALCYETSTFAVTQSTWGGEESTKSKGNCGVPYNQNAHSEGSTETTCPTVCQNPNSTITRHRK